MISLKYFRIPMIITCVYSGRYLNGMRGSPYIQSINYNIYKLAQKISYDIQTECKDLPEDQY